MTWLRMLGARLAGLFRRSRGDADLDEELQFHLEMEEAENRRKGMSAGEARIAARRSFGNFTGKAGVSPRLRLSHRMFAMACR